MDDLNRRLAEAAEARAKQEKLQRQAARLEAEFREAANRARELKKQLAKEERDVERLESGSLAALLASLFTNRAERLHREREEAAAALLRYREAQHQADQLQAELRAVRTELARLAGVEATYSSLLAEKERRLRAERGPAAEELLRLDQMEETLQAQMREIDEAISAGRSADASLARVITSLRSAEGWGTWDMLGGGFVATMAKHSHIDEAQKELYAAQQALASFRRELADVGASASLPSVELDGFTRFADYFFDNFFVDWMVQRRIQEGIKAVEGARGRVAGLLRSLQEQKRSVQSELEQVRHRRAQLIIDYL